MDNWSRKILEKHIRAHMTSDRRTLLVFKGFSRTFLEQVSLKKLVDVPIGVTVDELQRAKPKILLEAFTKLAQPENTMLWATYEELVTISESHAEAFGEVVVLQNNLYGKVFPCLYEVEDIEGLYIQHFESDEELNTNELHPAYQLFCEYYGSLRRINEEYYVTYAASSKNEIPFYDTGGSVTHGKQSMYDHSCIELSENEDDFLALTSKLLERQYPHSDVIVAYSGDLRVFSNDYESRLAILQQIVGDTYRIALVTKTTEKKTEIDAERYLNILRQYWGYSSFRDLRMYRDTNDPEGYKDTVYVSQVQIIDDVVRQAERCLAGQSYSDIFVTAPTGAGKSLIYQLPAIYLAKEYNAMTIVISPLIGLMFDQVDGLQRRDVDFSATINSELAPSEKMQIMERIKDGRVSILYISPETLLSRSDIRQLIGDRRVGLFVIDEAHIVTTWGKSFRADYWYLGTYLQRLRKEMQFPIATFTATAIYGGIEDMYTEIRDSLNLTNTITYFGYIKRDDIDIRIQHNDNERKYREYLNDKFKVLLVRLTQFLKRNEKTLVYFPTVRLLQQFKRYAHDYGSPELVASIVLYFGNLDKDLKREAFQRFRNNEASIMLATKAFGMGIDIPDIDNVYHFAPTGNVCDYVQEIGRAARELKEGRAYYDFLSHDFVHINRLHGISTLRKQQLVQVMAKLLRLMDENEGGGNARRLLVSSDEFRYIFERRSSGDQQDDVDNKLKTALLIIEKDFLAKMEYSPIIARPRGLFAAEYVRVNREIEHLIKNEYAPYFEKIRHSRRVDNSYGDLYRLDMKKLWETWFSQLSFPEFKYRFYQSDSSLSLPFLGDIHPVLRIEVDLGNETPDSVILKVQHAAQTFRAILGDLRRTQRYFGPEELARLISKGMALGRYAAENLASILLSTMENYQQMRRAKNNFFRIFLTFSERNGGKYRLENGHYEDFLDWLHTGTRSFFSNSVPLVDSRSRFERFVSKSKRREIDETFLVLGILEALGLVVYRSQGGDNPEIYIFVSSRLQLERVVSNPARYRNLILENVHQRHTASVAMLRYLFSRGVGKDEFWDTIEDYFLGRMPSEVEEELNALMLSSQMASL